MVDVESLEDRLERLERIVGLNENGSREAGNKPIVDQLVGINAQLNASVEKRDKIKEVFKSTKQIQDVQNNAYVENLCLSEDELKLMTTSSIPRMELMMRQLEAIKEGLPVLDSEHIRHAPSLRPKLNKLTLANSSLQEDISKYTEEVGAAVGAYNELMEAISRQLAYANRLLDDKEKGDK